MRSRACRCARSRPRSPSSAARTRCHDGEQASAAIGTVPAWKWVWAHLSSYAAAARRRARSNGPTHWGSGAHLSATPMPIVPTPSSWASIVLGVGAPDTRASSLQDAPRSNPRSARKQSRRSVRPYWLHDVSSVIGTLLAPWRVVSSRSIPNSEAMQKVPSLTERMLELNAAIPSDASL